MMKPPRTKNLRRLIAIGALSLLTATLHARTWTASDDATKTFDGDLKSYNSETEEVTIIHSSGRALTFPIAKLTEEDQTFVKENSVIEAKPEDVTAALEAQKIGQNISGKLVQLDGKRLKKTKLTFAPEYYLLYFSASW